MNVPVPTAPQSLCREFPFSGHGVAPVIYTGANIFRDAVPSVLNKMSE